MTQLPTNPKTLNEINAQIIGGRVRVSALMDVRGLDKLERKISALRALIADDDNEGESSQTEQPEDLG